MLIMAESFANEAIETGRFSALEERFGPIVIVRDEDYQTAVKTAVELALKNGRLTGLFKPKGSENEPGQEQPDHSEGQK